MPLGPDRTNMDAQIKITLDEAGGHRRPAVRCTDSLRNFRHAVSGWVPFHSFAHDAYQRRMPFRFVTIALSNTPATPGSGTRTVLRVNDKKTRGH